MRFFKTLQVSVCDLPVSAGFLLPTCDRPSPRRPPLPPPHSMVQSPHLIPGWQETRVRLLPNGPTNNATPSQPPSSCQHMPRDCDHHRACVLPTTDAHQGEWSSPTPLPHLHHPALNTCCAVPCALSTNRHTTQRPNGPAQRHSLAVSITPAHAA
ncbi:hypothetical protein F5148DRAFT_612042 [Russula earlei]|uniref:Uncharacterized protein n=1 Tax=Russula earlei TaxID=71964 RepID=A0ACC0TUX3_9AGAM|nr:hypothetical protein F5148DRAFT_612042 [Russula earlei]